MVSYLLKRIFIFIFAAFTTVESMDWWIFESCHQAQAIIHCPAFARGGRQNVRKINGICTGIYKDTMRISRTTRLQQNSGVFGRGLQFGRTFHGN